MSEILDSIVKCDISIEAPVENGESFSTIMIIGNRPITGGNGIKDVDKYASLAEILDAGWKEDSSEYKAARAAFMQEPKPEFIYIAVRKDSEVSGEELEDKEADSENLEAESATTDIISIEKYSKTVERVLGISGWYGLVLVGADKSDYDEVANLIESTEKLFIFITNEKKNPLSRKDYLRTIGFYSEFLEEYAHIAWMAKCFSFSPGSETWEYKTLTGVTPSILTSREMRNLNEDNLNYYVTCASRNISRVGKVLGEEWIDVIRFRDWLKNQMQLKIFELFVKNPKIPYLDDGITLVENQMREVLQNGQSVGGISKTEYDEDDNPVAGYTIVLPRAVSLSSAQRKTRKLPGCKFTARLAGAIQVVEMQGNLLF